MTGSKKKTKPAKLTMTYEQALSFALDQDSGIEDFTWLDHAEIDEADEAEGKPPSCTLPTAYALIAVLYGKTEDEVTRDVSKELGAGDSDEDGDVGGEDDEDID